MFNLVKYRKLFLLISLIVIIPGAISLIIFQLNPGIDFVGGATVTLRPQITYSDTTQIQKLLAPFNLKNEQIVLGTDAQQAKQPTAWVRLNQEVTDSATQTKVESAVEAKYSGQTLAYTWTNITNDGAPYTIFTVSKFSSAPKTSDLQTVVGQALKSAASTTTPKATATPTTSVTPQATATTTANPTPNTNQSSTNTTSTPATVSDVKVTSTGQTINILTLSGIAGASQNKDDIKLSDIQGSFLKQGGPYFQIVSNSSVGPSVANQTVIMAFMAVAAASILILAYVWFSFRKVPKALRYGVCAIVALLHDVLVVLGIFSILGHFFGIQVDSLFITALLTVIGFSVHDTIVVFDRIRENMQRHTIESFEEVVNASLVQTLARSLNTSLTVLFTLLALTLFTGIGTDIHTFTLTLLIGIFSGTYSSIFNASMMLVMWENGEWIFGFGKKKSEENASSNRSKNEVRELARSRG